MKGKTESQLYLLTLEIDPMNNSPLRKCTIAFTLIFLSSCIERFEFNSESEPPVVIVEGFISDISSDNYLDLFGEPRLFFVKLKYAGAVKNFIDETISRAEVQLISDQNEHWDYTEDANEPGTYYLYYSSFRSEPNIKYKVNVKLENGEEYESDFDQMPSQDIRGEININETSKLQKVVVSQEHVIRSFVGVDVNIQMPASSEDSFRYFRWDFHTTWMVVAELASRSGPFGVCWMSETYNLDENVIVRKKGLPSNINLFFVRTTRNPETKFGFAVVIKQQEMSEEYYQFWTDLHNQESQAELFAPPPYNIHTNINAIGHERGTYGYFGVVNEEYYIWHLDKKALSYVPYYFDQCHVEPPLSPAEWCRNCLGYDGINKGAEITNIKPDWWTF
ncbi:DUF4249 family protein [Reichenbachiella sp.]|uniref:DUF4249 family protein n=1 Tax=Reichenbachiella sp. TaxID=2184521 RepID=UPI0032969998